MNRIKIFLVEDEVMIRNGIKNSIDWAKEGLEFVGEAPDGELAYPLIKKTKPDILLTDIKMPFMDGLELSELVKKELPDIKILVLSGYDEFDYAKKAITIGITDYLLKPIAADKLLEVIRQVSETIKKEREDKELLAYYTQETRETLENEKLKFFNMLMTGTMSMTDILERGRELNLEFEGSAYTIVLFKILNGEGMESYYSQLVEASEKIIVWAERRNNVAVFLRGVEGMAFLFSGMDEAEVTDNIEAFKEDVAKIMKEYPMLEYFGGIGRRVDRIRELKNSFRTADSVFANRFVVAACQILSYDEAEMKRQKEKLDVTGVGSMEHNRELIHKFLRNGTEAEVDSFVKAYFNEIPGDSLKSMMMRQYLGMDIYISVNAFGESLELPMEQLQDNCGDVNRMIADIQDEAGLYESVKKILTESIRLRDAASGRRYSDILASAKAFIEKNYMTEEISLNSVASKVNLSPSYFSSVFSQEVGQTFVEYLTQIRMEKAKELLMCSSMKSAEIGYEVGYKDPHYFSYLFKKTQKCTPKEYRLRRKASE